ncbi:MAG TPA: AAA family ATPase [Myxococcus sp.]|nr:AAA family ATPase [Myxococcus sp.]
MIQLPEHQAVETVHESPRTTIVRARSGGTPLILKYPTASHPTLSQVAAYRREASLLGQVHSEGVIRALGLVFLDNRPVLRLEDVGATCLRRRVSTGPLSPSGFLTVAPRIVTALGDLHRAGIIHKGINPKNILCSADGTAVKLIDLSRASPLHTPQPEPESVEDFEGSLAYLSPEQTGRMRRAVDHRTDFYSLGVTFYELLTGQVPFPEGGDPLEIMHQHLARMPVPPHALCPDVPPQLSALVMKLLAKDAEERYQSASGLLQDLEACRKALLDGAAAAPFALGEHDRLARFHLPQKLYGREQELQAVLGGFQRARAGGSEVLLIRGVSGIGKSSLVHEAHPALVRGGGRFLQARFEQYRRDVPYGALALVLRELLRHLLREGETEKWSALLREALGSNAALVASVIPELGPLLGVEPEAHAGKSHEARNRFHFSVQRLLAAIASPQVPLVLFIDDLQWADSGALELLKSLLTDPGLGAIFFIGAYRDSEDSGPDSLLGHTLASIHAMRPLRELRLGPLAPARIEELLVDAFRVEPAEARELALLVREKTGGIPFFVGELLRVLHAEGLLDFSWEQRRWTWNLEAIRQHDITDNMVELVTARIRRAPPALQELLRVAACVDAEFDSETLAALVGVLAGEVEPLLQSAMEDGLVQGWRGARGARHYRFVHDKVQEAAYALCSKGERIRIHLQRGWALFAEGTHDKARTFTIVEHLNAARPVITEPEERLRLAELNLRAGQAAKRSAALAAAMRYLRIGVSLLPEDAWARCPTLSWELFLELGEAEALNGHPEASDQALAQVLANARTHRERLPAYIIRIAALNTRGEFAEAIRMGIEALRLLGIDLPVEPEAVARATRVEREKLRGLLSGRSISSLVELPEMTDPDLIDALNILLRIAPSAYIGLPFLVELIACKQATLSLEHGHTLASAAAYNSLAVFRMPGAHEDIEAGEALGQLSLVMLERIRGTGGRPGASPEPGASWAHGAFDELECAIYVNFGYGGMLNHWKSPLRQGLPYLRDASLLALERGNFEYVVHLSNFYALNALFCWDDLEALRTELDARDGLLRKLGLDRGCEAFYAARQLTLTLLGECELGPVLAGDHFDEREARERLLARGDMLSMAWLTTLKAVFACTFGDFAGALRVLSEDQRFLAGSQGLMLRAEIAFLEALALAHQADVVAPEAREQYLRRITAYQEDLVRWAAHCPANFQHRAVLIAGELARLRGEETLSVVTRYEESARLAQEQGFLLHAGLAWERAAELWLHHGLERYADSCLREARATYERLGARAKVAHLVASHPRLQLQRARHTGDGWMAAPARAHAPGGSQTLDLSTVMKASQAISGEILHEKLLTRLLHIAMECAGAQRGTLVLRRGREDFVEAEGSVDAGVVLPGIPLPSATRLSLAVVRSVLGTGQRVLLADASSEGPFVDDPYIASHRVRSILCAPIIRQGVPAGVFYLENNLSGDAFTDARLELLLLLSAQAAISLENARLYRELAHYSHTLEQRVAERTEELNQKNTELQQTLASLRRMQAQLILQEKLASLGSLTAGIAHEIRNPLNFVDSFSALSEELVDEVLALARNRPALGLDSDQELRPLFEQLRGNAGRIREHALRASKIVEGMLLHSRHSNGERRVADLNKLVAEAMNLAWHGRRTRAGGTDVTFERDLQEPLAPLELMPGEISQVLINLLNNAIDAALEKHRRAGASPGARVRVTTRDVGHQVELRIRDNGIGLSPAVRKRIFEPFFTTKAPGEGTGLGLSISHDIIVQGHGGEIRVESEEGHATEFVVLLPRGRAGAP